MVHAVEAVTVIALVNRLMAMHEEFPSMIAEVESGAMEADTV